MSARRFDDYLKTASAPQSLHNVAKEGNCDEILQWLNQQQPGQIGAKINTTDLKGYSPLMYAAYSGHENVVELLLAHAANPNSSDTSGNSILMGVAFKGHLRIAHLLLKAGANVLQRNSQSQSALDFAHLFGRTEMAQLLGEHAHRETHEQHEADEFRNTESHILEINDSGLPSPV